MEAVNHCLAMIRQVEVWKQRVESFVPTTVSVNSFSGHEVILSAPPSENWVGCVLRVASNDTGAPFFSSIVVAQSNDTLYLFDPVFPAYKPSEDSAVLEPGPLLTASLHLAHVNSIEDELANGVGEFVVFGYSRGRTQDKGMDSSRFGGIVSRNSLLSFKVQAFSKVVLGKNTDANAVTAALFNSSRLHAQVLAQLYQYRYSSKTWRPEGAIQFQAGLGTLPGVHQQMDVFQAEFSIRTL